MLEKNPLWEDLLVNFAKGAEIFDLFHYFCWNAVRCYTFPNVEVGNYVRYLFISSQCDEIYFLVWI